MKKAVLLSALSGALLSALSLSAAQASAIALRIMMVPFMEK
jgi:hypothetical protein